MNQNEVNDDLEYKLYKKLLNEENYLHESALKKGCLYFIFARNAHLGIWIPESRGFIISRYKFDDNCLFMEYHWDVGQENCGTVKPFKEIEKSPFKELELKQLHRDVLYEIGNKEVQDEVLIYLNKKAVEYPFLSCGRALGLIS